MNVTLELMLTAADAALRAGDFARANVILDSVGHILDNGGSVIDPMATSYLNIVRAAAEAALRPRARQVHVPLRVRHEQPDAEKEPDRADPRLPPGFSPR